MRNNQNVKSLGGKRELRAQERADMLYVETFSAVSCFLGVLEDFERGKIKKKEAEKKCSLVYNVFRNFTREKEEQWGTTAIQEAWSVAEVKKIILLRRDILLAKIKAKNTPKIKEYIDMIERYISMATTFVPQKSRTDRVLDSLFFRLIEFLIKRR